ncbi:MAG: phage minor capsid protein [Bacilli bacterium]
MNDYDIKELYEEMEKSIISSMKRNYQRHLQEESEVGFKYTQWQAEKLKELKRYQRQNANIINGYTKGLDKKVSEHMQRELKQGAINAIKQYNKVLGKNLKPSKVMNKF